MYKIIGADQKEYGPVSADELREWIREGRVSGQTAIQVTGGEWRPLSSYPELAPLLTASPATAVALASRADNSVLPTDILERDYDLDIGACLTRAWELLKAKFWPIFGISFLILICPGIINQIIGIFTRPLTEAIIREWVERQHVNAGAICIVLAVSVISMPVHTLFMAGLLRYYIMLIRGEPAHISDAFSGFTRAPGQLILLSFVNGILVLLGFILCVIPGIYLSVAWYFATALIVDKQLNFWTAMETSRRVVTRHWFLVFALILLAGIISMVGIFACCIGIFASVAFAQIALMYAYEDIFGNRTTAS